MKKTPTAKYNGIKNVKMTLKGYYESLSAAKSPLQEFVDAVVSRCGVSEQTVRNWCLYGIRPQSYAHVKVLMELTGLKEEELW